MKLSTQTEHLVGSRTIVSGVIAIEDEEEDDDEQADEDEEEEEEGEAEELPSRPSSPPSSLLGSSVPVGSDSIIFIRARLGG